MPVLVFDCETIPDFAVEIQSAWDASPKNGKLKPGLQQVVAVACAWIEDTGKLAALRSLGTPGSDEADLVREFFRGVEDRKPRLAGWNTNGYDMPLLVARAMAHNIPAPGFYRVGAPRNGYRYRYDEEHHIDLMDLLSNYGASAALKLDEMAAVLGIPGKLGVDGSMVLDLWKQGEIQRIRDYCETDVLTTALAYGRYARHRGWWDEEKWERFEASVREFLEGAKGQEHWGRFGEKVGDGEGGWAGHGGNRAVTGGLLTVNGMTMHTAIRWG